MVELPGEMVFDRWTAPMDRGLAAFVARPEAGGDELAYVVLGASATAHPLVQPTTGSRISSAMAWSGRGTLYLGFEDAATPLRLYAFRGPDSAHPVPLPPGTGTLLPR